MSSTEVKSDVKSFERVKGLAGNWGGVAFSLPF